MRTHGSADTYLTKYAAVVVPLVKGRDGLLERLKVERLPIQVLQGNTLESVYCSVCAHVCVSVLFLCMHVCMCVCVRVRVPWQVFVQQIHLECTLVVCACATLCMACCRVQTILSKAVCACATSLNLWSKLL